MHGQCPYKRIDHLSATVFFGELFALRRLTRLSHAYPGGAAVLVDELYARRSQGAPQVETKSVAALSSASRHVRLSKIAPLEQQRGLLVVGQSISKAVAEIELGAMSSAAISVGRLCERSRLAWP